MREVNMLFKRKKTSTNMIDRRIEVTEPPLRKSVGSGQGAVAILDRPETSAQVDDTAEDREIVHLKRQLRENEEVHAMKAQELTTRITTLRAEIMAIKSNGGASCAHSARSNSELSRRIMRKAMHAAGLNTHIGALLEPIPETSPLFTPIATLENGVPVSMIRQIYNTAFDLSAKSFGVDGSKIRARK
jgi:hypothetical protein